MATFEDIIGQWQNVFDDLFEIAGAAEDTSVVTNLQVIDAAPSGLSGYIIVAGAAGGLNFRGPVVTLPGQAWTNGDFVNVLFRKGTNPIAMGAGSGSGSSPFRVSIVYNSTLANAIIEVDATGNVVVNSAQLDRDFTVNVDSGIGLFVNGASGDVFFGGSALGRLTDLDTFFDFSTADAIQIYAGGQRLLAIIEDTQDIVQVNPAQIDADFEVGYNGGVALFTDGANGDATFGADLTVTGNVAAVDANLTGTASVDQRVESPLYEFPLISTGGEGSHILDNDSSYPAGWTEADAASATDTNTLYSHWYLVGTSAETSWKYRIQTSTDLENDVAASAQCRFMFGPIIFKNAAYTADVDYYFGMYRNNAGAIDENTFCRVHLQWDQSAGLWQIRGETKDSSSSTQHDGTWVTFSDPVNSKFWVVLGVTNSATKTCLNYMGANYVPAGAGSLAAEFMNNLQVQNPTTALTWGDVWLQVHQTRGAGATDRLLIGAYDRLS